ncbi:MAG: YncE family protein [Candidatus Riflebacteria bacterium]|nr:YncE family protein [Candidatus Riflebacteria bacterium]
MFNRNYLTLSVLLAICSSALFAAPTTGSASNSEATPSQYAIVNTFHVEGEGGWDYITMDDSSGRLFVSHATVVNVLEAKTGKLLGTIPDTQGVHGISVATDLKKGFTSNGKADSVTVFDIESLKTLGTVQVSGKNPDAILYDPISHNVFTFNGKTSNATVIDAKEQKVIATIALDGKPEFPTTNGKGIIYVNIEDKNEIQVIDTKTLKVTATWSIAPNEEPSGMAIDIENGRLFSVCGNKVMTVVDTQSGKVITTLPIGEHADGAAFDPGLKRAYSSNGDGTLTVIQEVDKDTFKVLENFPTIKGARTIGLSAATHHTYLPTAEFGPAPAPTTDHPKQRPSIKPGTFKILDIAPKN